MRTNKSSFDIDIADSLSSSVRPFLGADKTGWHEELNENGARPYEIGRGRNQHAPFYAHFPESFDLSDGCTVDIECSGEFSGIVHLQYFDGEKEKYQNLANIKPKQINLRESLPLEIFNDERRRINIAKIDIYDGNKYHELASIPYSRQLAVFRLAIPDAIIDKLNSHRSGAVNLQPTYHALHVVQLNQYLKWFDNAPAYLAEMIDAWTRAFEITPDKLLHPECTCWALNPDMRPIYMKSFPDIPADKLRYSNMSFGSSKDMPLNIPKL